MKKLLPLVFLLSGCAVNSTPPMASEDMVLTPVCKSDAECEIMWGRAHQAIQDVTGMRLQVADSAYLQTYNGSPFTKLSGTVMKEPNPGGGTRIVAMLNCDRLGWCANLLNMGVSAFNEEVSGSSKTVREEQSDNILKAVEAAKK